MSGAALGHSDPKLTARVYTHLEVEDLRVAVEAPAGAIAMATPQPLAVARALAAVGGSAP